MAILDRNSVISTCFFHVDILNKTKEQIAGDLKNQDLEVYLETLLVEINNKEQKRIFDFSEPESAFKLSTRTVSESADLSVNFAGENLVQKLLDQEITTNERYKHLGKNDGAHVKTGSFLQFIYKENGNLRYLGVKVDHLVILDDIDFKKRKGLSLTEKVYKAFKVDFDDKKSPTCINIYDSKSGLTKYWWAEFLELRERNTDTFNTTTACTETITKLATLKKEFPQDYTILRNATVAAFKQEGSIDYFKFLDATISNYKSDNNEFEEAKQKLIIKLKDLPKNKGFDTVFELVPSAVPFRNTNYKLTTEISLSIREGISNLSEKVWSEITSDGRELVVIESKLAKQFKRKEREL
ncbi:hypothetical protein C4J89_0267 [Pseudomonas sp. R4-35-07]|uniref:hypothetical protein n=1 Tax=Pseudomonas sp. R4-35-07 TaxID=658643 RepID=UPI000F5711D0|nr:hypothetical protein [Pseudomonas sp. R4-35-07]AZF29774.1 hypothetical protein C4J89_0267 [Pseudomonas sp. R4-35-07]